MFIANAHGLSNEQQQEACLKVFQKAWIAYTKYLKHQVFDKKQLVVCNIFGAFTALSNTGLSDSRVAFAPSTELLRFMKVKFDAKYPTNVESVESLCALVDASKRINTNY